MHLNQDGTTAVEFAMVAPVFILLVIGTIGLCFALFLVGSLHFAVEDGARCASVKTTICADAASTIAYTRSRYLGPNVSPTFTYTSAACGNSVSASVSYSMDVGFKTFVVPISATACFP
ncbi:TadE/TadG family type IV pilus assembly protein [Bradyrhizobium sp. PMVTL-01]|uniref:TadE/TadG family type IV pilus assembly protein n=1 Tax=Bradyrhizobium sp. PMVTL-01 TaxID=3434999 RepID=UPI003F71F48C